MTAHVDVDTRSDWWRRYFWDPPVNDYALSCVLISQAFELQRLGVSGPALHVLGALSFASNDDELRDYARAVERARRRRLRPPRRRRPPNVIDMLGWLRRNSASSAEPWESQRPARAPCCEEEGHMRGPVASTKHSKRTPLCPSCGSSGTRIGQFDAYSCGVCNAWLEERCDDTTCSFCADRPNRPSAVSEAQTTTRDHPCDEGSPTSVHVKREQSEGEGGA